MTHRIRKALVASVVSFGTAAAMTGPAFAASSSSSAPSSSTASTSASTTPAASTSTGSTSGSSTSPTTTDSARLAAIKAKAKVAIGARLSSLSFAISDVKTNAYITATDKATLLATLNGDVTGLTALGTTIQGDTTVTQALADYDDIFSQYRVYALALPQVLFASAADDITTTVIPALTDAQTRLEALLNGVDKGKDTPPVQAAMNDLAAQIKDSTALTNGLSASVLAFTPAQWDANHAILTAPRESLQTAQIDDHTARSDIAFVVEALES